MTNILKEQYKTLKASNPTVRAKEAAEVLEVSEGDLVACRVGEDVTLLQDRMEDILKAVVNAGEVMALTRNDSCVHERKGVYLKAKFLDMGERRTGLLVNPDIDLRLFMNYWKHAFALSEDKGDRKMHSLQFFDGEGVAVHKIYATDKTDMDAWHALVEAFTAEEQVAGIETEAYSESRQLKEDKDVDWSGFRQDWENMTDVHEFFSLLNKFEVGREQGFRKIGEDFAYAVDPSAARALLEIAAARDCEIMVFTGNRGCVQIHTGPVKKLKEVGKWYNVLDPAFNLHLDESRIARIWVTKKPTRDGIITSVEVYDAASEQIASFFGRRKPGKPEQDLWRDIVENLPALEISYAA